MGCAGPRNPTTARAPVPASRQQAARPGATPHLHTRQRRRLLPRRRAWSASCGPSQSVPAPEACRRPPSTLLTRGPPAMRANPGPRREDQSPRTFAFAWLYSSVVSGPERYGIQQFELSCEALVKHNMITTMLRTASGVNAANRSRVPNSQLLRGQRARHRHHMPDVRIWLAAAPSPAGARGSPRNRHHCCQSHGDAPPHLSRRAEPGPGSLSRRAGCRARTSPVAPAASRSYESWPRPRLCCEWRGTGGSPRDCSGTRPSTPRRW